MAQSCSGVILAGGRNSRFGGRNKALLDVGGIRILERIYRIFRELFDDILIVTNQPRAYLSWDANIVTDLFDVRCSLTGIHAGLFYSRHPYAFFAACDTPFIRPATIRTVLERIEPHLDVVIPQTSSGLEPLCAAYSRRCIGPMEQRLNGGKFQIQGLLQRVRTRIVSEIVLLRVDPSLQSFFNINTPDDLARAREMLTDSAAGIENSPPQAAGDRPP